MGFTSIPQTLINVGKALVQPLFQYLKDNDDYLYSKIGSIEGNGILNGSFEIDSDRDDRPDLWALNMYPGGSGGLSPSEVTGTDGLTYTCIADHTAADATKPVTGASWSTYWSQKGSNGSTWATGKKYKSLSGSHGKDCVWFEHPGGIGNGGGYIESDYISTGISQKILTFAYKCSVANIKVVCEILWYDKDKVYLSSTTAWNRSADNPLRWAMVMLSAIPVPVNARFMKIRLIGGATDVNVAGTVWFDNVEFVDEPLPAMTSLTESINQAQVSTTAASYADIGSAWTINIPSSIGALLVGVEINGSDLGTGAYGVYARMRINTIYSNEIYSYGPYYQPGFLYLNVESLSGVQTLRFQIRSTVAGATAYLRSPSSVMKAYTGRGFIVDVLRNAAVERSMFRGLSGSSAWWGTDTVCQCQCTCPCTCPCPCQCTCTAPCCG